MPDTVPCIRRAIGLFLLIGLSVLSFSALAGAEGQLDTSFGPAHSGKVTVPFNVSGGLVDLARGVATQSSGKIIVVGLVQDGASEVGIGVVRLNANGVADTSFGNNGTGQITKFLDATTKILGIVMQADDRFIVYGNTAVGAGGMFAMRFLADGSAADPSWGSSGLAVIDFPGLHVVNSSAALNSAGQLYLAGYTLAVGSSNGDFAVAKLTTSGALDTTFGRKTVAFDMGGNLVDQANAVALQDDGKLLLAGEAEVSGNTTVFALARLDPDTGALDSSFGNQAAGLSIAPIPGSADGCINNVVALALSEVSASQRTLLVGGTHCQFDRAASAAVAAFDNAGQPSDGFGSSGVAIADIYAGFYESGEIAAMTLQPTAIQPGPWTPYKLILSGSARYILYPHEQDMVSLRLDATGAVDASYGNAGYSNIPFDLGGSNNDLGQGAALAGGYLLQIGYAELDGGNRDFAVARLLVGDRIMADNFDPVPMPL